MRIDEFRALPEQKRVALVNKRLQELKEEKKATPAFRNDELEFSYSTAIKDMVNLGYGRNGQVFEKELKLTDKEIMLLKTLASDYEFTMQAKIETPKVVVREDDKTVTTSVRMYAKVWARWQAFTSRWSVFNGLDLMASALEEYMDKHEFEDYETLKEQGKIKDK